MNGQESRIELYFFLTKRILKALEYFTDVTPFRFKVNYMLSSRLIRMTIFPPANEIISDDAAFGLPFQTFAPDVRSRSGATNIQGHSFKEEKRNNRKAEIFTPSPAVYIAYLPAPYMRSFPNKKSRALQMNIIF